MDAGFLQKLTGWRNGDLDYSGSINADDYFLMDYAFANQSSLPAPLAFGPMSVPEPDLVALMAAVGFLGLLMPRSWQKRPGPCFRSRK
jgi:hypothetical protein